MKEACKTRGVQPPLIETSDLLKATYIIAWAHETIIFRACSSCKSRLYFLVLYNEKSFVVYFGMYIIIARRAVALLGGRGGVYIHIFAFCPTNFF